MQLPYYLSQKRFFKWVFPVLVFAAGLLSGLVIDEYVTGDDHRSLVGKEQRVGGYRFINPLLECETAKDTIGDKELRPFKYKVEGLIAQKIKSGEADYIAVYFRDLNDGPWLGINEKEKFAPASLLKLPVMIAYLKLSESNPALLTKKFRYEGGEDFNSGQHFKPSKGLEKGKYYTTDELIYRMIAYSDNNSKNILLKNLNPSALAKIYLDLGVTMPGLSQPDDFMSVKNYASFFRILFNASYMNTELSEKALRYLSEVEFKLGLGAGIPSSVPVAHKFGERSVSDGPVKQLHDCGIIYYPNSPYLLCVMTRGKEFDKLDDVIRNISYLVYNEIDSQVSQPLTK